MPRLGSSISKLILTRLILSNSEYNLEGSSEVRFSKETFIFDFGSPAIKIPCHVTKKPRFF